MFRTTSPYWVSWHVNYYTSPLNPIYLIMWRDGLFLQLPLLLIGVICFILAYLCLNGNLNSPLLHQSAADNYYLKYERRLAYQLSAAIIVVVILSTLVMWWLNKPSLCWFTLVVLAYNAPLGKQLAQAISMHSSLIGFNVTPHRSQAVLILYSSTITFVLAVMSTLIPFPKGFVEVFFFWWYNIIWAIFWFLCYIRLSYPCLGCIKKHEFNLFIRDKKRNRRDSNMCWEPIAKYVPIHKRKLCANCADKYDIEHSAILIIYLLLILSMYFGSIWSTGPCLLMSLSFSATHYYLGALVYYWKKLKFHPAKKSVMKWVWYICIGLLLLAIIQYFYPVWWHPVYAYFWGPHCLYDYTDGKYGYIYQNHRLVAGEYVWRDLNQAEPIIRPFIP